MNIIQEQFGQINENKVTSYTMKNNNGMEVTVIDYGCTITSIIVPDKHGNFENVVLGFDSIEEYVENSPFFGSIIGRVAGRIQDASFILDDKNYKLLKNDGNNHLHGGKTGFDKILWDCTVEENVDSISLVFSYYSKDGEEGYPGNIDLKVIYSLNEANELTLTYEGIPEEKTILNLTNHTYFNLSGDLKRDILDHRLTLKSSHYLELDSELIPTGELVPVENTVFDFRNGRNIKDGVDSKDIQNVTAGNGYDHPFVLSANEDREIVLEDSESGRVICIETNQSSVVLYTGTQLQDNFSIRNIQSRKYLGLCLETQGYPDAINHEHFPNIVVEKNNKYLSVTKCKFLTVQN